MQCFYLELMLYFVIEPYWAFVITYDCFMRNNITDNVENRIRENNYFFIDTIV